MGDSHLIKLDESINNLSTKVEALIGCASRIENTLLQILETQAGTVPQPGNPVCPDWKPDESVEYEPKKDDKPKRRGRPKKAPVKKPEAETPSSTTPTSGDAAEEEEAKKPETDTQPPSNDSTTETSPDTVTAEEAPAITVAEVQAKAKSSFIVGGGRTVQDWRDWLAKNFGGKNNLASLTPEELAQASVWIDAVAKGEMEA